MNWFSPNDVQNRLRQLGIASSGCNKTDLNSIKEAENNIFNKETYATKREALFKERLENEFIFKFDSPHANSNLADSMGEEFNSQMNLDTIENLPVPTFLKEILSTNHKNVGLNRKQLDFLS